MSWKFRLPPALLRLILPSSSVFFFLGAADCFEPALDMSKTPTESSRTRGHALGTSCPLARHAPWHAWGQPGGGVHQNGLVARDLNPLHHKQCKIRCNVHFPRATRPLAKG